jgi:thymidine kinase
MERISRHILHHLDAMRGLSDVSFVLIDEADFFPPGQQQDARDVSERYIAKSNPWIIMVSTFSRSVTVERSLASDWST